MNIAILGKSGFTGTYVSKKLQSKHNVYGVPSAISSRGGEELLEIIEKSDVIINLAGENIFKRWTRSNREKIRDSRVEITRNISEVIRKAQSKPSLYITASATGIYDDTIIQTETNYSYASGDFVPDLVKDWEEQAMSISDYGVRTVIMRFGIIMGQGGALQKMLPVFKAGIAVITGKRNTAFPFVHIEDVARAVEFIIVNQNCKGVYNMVSPHIITNAEFAATLADICGSKITVRVPVFILRLLFGSSSKIMTETARVRPQRLKDAGFIFSYGHIKKTLESIVL